jgi:hypothetical protein
MNDLKSVTPNITIEVGQRHNYKKPYKQEYLHYLESARWRNLSRAVRRRARGMCEICLRADGQECAHLTYERIFNERMTDLLWLCKKCHRELDNW